MPSSLWRAFFLAKPQSNTHEFRPPVVLDAYAVINALHFAVKWASWNVFCFVAGISLVITLGSTYILLRSIPSYDEIQALRNEKAQLSNTINVLEQRGGRATVGNCPTQGNSQRMCVRVIGSGGERYFAVIDGY